MEYKVLVGESPDILATAVEKYVASGWNLVGGVSAYFGSCKHGIFTQAVIKGD